MEQPRSVVFHWVANMIFAGIALLGGVLFGMEVEVGRALVVIGVGALLLVPLTRRWERTGISRRQAESGKEQPDSPGGESNLDS